MFLLKYIRVFLKNFSNNLSIEMSFRINFFLLFFVEMMHLLVLLGSVHILFNHIDTIGPWNKNDFLFFSILVTIFDSIFLGFIAGNFWKFSELLRLGTFDFILTKPINSLFLTLTQVQRFSGMFSAFLTTIVLIWFSSRLDISWTFGHWVAFSILFFLGIILRLGLEMLLGTLMFITIEGEAINFFRINLQQFAKHPSFIYGGSLNFLMTKVFPLCLVTTLPVDWVLGKSVPPITLGTAIVVLLIAIFISWGLTIIAWRWGVNRYESASS